MLALQTKDRQQFCSLDHVELTFDIALFSVGLGAVFFAPKSRFIFATGYFASLGKGTVKNDWKQNLSEVCGCLRMSS